MMGGYRAIEISAWIHTAIVSIGLPPFVAVGQRRVFYLVDEDCA